MALTTEFITFRNKLVLDSTQMGRIQSAVDSLSEKLIKKYDLKEGEVFLQGSVPNGTAVKPDPENDDGEYDVDLVGICAQDDASPEEAIKDLERVLEESGYKDFIEPMEDRPCVRLQYADEEHASFHVDVVPARESSGEAPLEVPRPANGWHETDPQSFTKWCAEQGDVFLRTVQMLKRWRDHNQDAHSAIKSILFQVLISEHLGNSASDDARIAETLNAISEFVNSNSAVPTIPNPVLPNENLAERWSNEEFQNFRGLISAAAEVAQLALTLADKEASEKWRELFGKDFPLSNGGDDAKSYVPPGTQGRAQSAPNHGGWG